MGLEPTDHLHHERLEGTDLMSEEAKQAQRALQESLDLRDQDHTDA